MNQKSILLLVIAIAGIGCLMLGIYWTFAKSDNTGSPVTQISKTIIVPIHDFYSNGWEYGPTVEYAGKPNPVAVWMGGAGEITYHLNFPAAPGAAKLTAILSGELHRDRTKVVGNGTSDVEVVVNGVSIGTQNVMRDNDRHGEQYIWTIPKGTLKTGVNEIAFRVKDNGLNVWTIGNFGGLQLEL